jgi:hypothetical protein
VNYFTLLSHGERAPVTRDLVWSGLRGHRHLARAARKRILKRQISEDAQVEQVESLTRNIRGHRCLARTARKRILERQISEDAQVKQDESLTRNKDKGKEYKWVLWVFI